MNARLTTALAALTAVASVAPGASAQCWGETAELTPASQTSYVGTQVAIDGGTALVTAVTPGWPPPEGAAWVFELDAQGSWVEVTELVPVNAIASDFGLSADLCGDTAVVGGMESGGIVHVFERDQGGPGNWGVSAELTATGESFEFGFSVAISGDTVLVGAPRGGGPFGGPGLAYVFERDLGGPDAWGLVKPLSQIGSGATKFGNSVAIDGDDLVVGAHVNDESLHVYRRDQGGPGNWGPVKKLEPGPFVGSSALGQSVAICGDTIVGGDYRRAYAYERNVGGPENWGWTTTFAPPPEGNDSYYGWSVAVTPEWIAVGAPKDFVSTPGEVYLYGRQGTGWTSGILLQPEESAPSDWFGEDVAVSGGRVIAGSEFHVNPGAASGAAFVFEVSPAEVYCTSGVSASGCQASISTSGIPSASASEGFCLRVVDVEGAKDGLFFYGINGRQANSWGNSTSFVCVVPPRVRGGLLLALGSTAGACDGAFAQDLNARWCSTCPKPAHNYGAGAVVQAQFWYRDPHNPSNMTSSMSDAIEFTMQP